MATEVKKRRKFQFPSAITTLAIVTLLVWVVALILPSGQYQTDADGSPIPGTFETIPKPLNFAEMFQQLLLSPINGFYGLKDTVTGFVDTEGVGRMFGSVGVVMFIFAIGAFISVSFATKSLEVAVGGLASKLRSKGWLLIAAVMALFSLLGSTMGFSVETFGFYALLIPLMAALGYDRLVTASMIIAGALVGIAGSTVNPFSIGVASGEAGVSIGDGIILRFVLWIVLTGIAIFWVVRYAEKVRKDPSKSLVGFEMDQEDPISREAIEETAASTHRLSRMQIWVLVITAATFALMIFSVIPWSSLLGAVTGPAEDTVLHQTSAEPLWFDLGWWFPQLAILFFLSSVLVGFVARLGEKETVRLIVAGAADMLSPAFVIMLASGVSVIMTNSMTLETLLNGMEQLVQGASSAGFVTLTTLINIPLGIIIPSSSGHALLAMPLLAPLADFAGVARSTVITAWALGHGLTIMIAPTSVVVVGGVAVAKVGYDKYLKFMWPLMLILLVVGGTIIAVAATIG